MQYPWKQHYSHPVAIQNERCFPFLDYPCRRSAQKRPTPSPLSLFLRPILNHGVRRRPQDLWPRGKAPTRFSQNAWYCSNYVTMWIVCDMSICNLTDLDCKVFVFWSNRQHDQTSCRLVLLRVLPPKTAEGVENLRKRIVKMKVGSFENLSNSKLLILIFAWSLQWFLFFLQKSTLHSSRCQHVPLSFQ